MLVPINFTGGTYRHEAVPISAQTTRNFWPQLVGNEKAKSKYILRSFVGQTLWSSQVGGTNRGMFYNKGILYKITGTTLYTVDSAGVHTARGTIPGSERCRFAPFGDYGVINTATKRYHWNGSTLTLLTDADLEDGAGLTYLNSQMIYGGRNGRFGVSDVGDPTSISGLNYATAESNPDDLIFPYAFNQTAYMMGQVSIEPWYNSGQGNPPFERYDGAVINKGLGAIDSVSNDDENMFFLDDERKVQALRGSAASIVQPVSTDAMNEAFTKYSVASDAIGWTMNIVGQSFYVLTFPTENITWVKPQGGEWFEWSSGISGRNRADSYCFAFDKHLVADYSNGNIYELSTDVFDETGEEIIRVRDTAPIHGGLFQLDGKTLEMYRLSVFIDGGVGLISGQGSDPVIMVSFSDDGGRTFSTEKWARAGKLGDFKYGVRFSGLGRFTSRIIRIRVSDPVKWTILSGEAEIEACI